MGSCISAAATNYSGDDMPTAKVVLMDGSLLEFSTAVQVSLVLGLNGLSCFICNSDSLCYDHYIQALNPSELVVPGKLYFVMPIDMLKRILSGRDMAALAVKASSAIDQVVTKSKPNRGGVRIMPFAGGAEHDDNADYSSFNEYSVGVMSSATKWTVKTRKSAAPSPLKGGGRPFEVKLSAIEEVAE